MGRQHDVCNCFVAATSVAATAEDRDLGELLVRWESDGYERIEDCRSDGGGGGGGCVCEMHSFGRSGACERATDPKVLRRKRLSRGYPHSY